jgi:hypothetical protein
LARALWYAVVSGAALGSCRPATPAGRAPGPAVAPPGVPGTYDLAVCRGVPCAPGDTLAAYALVTVVLFDSAGAERADLPPARYAAGRRATGCFLTRYGRRLSDSYAGMWPRDYFRWSGADSSLRFTLFRSPDAYYVITARVTTEGLVGGGTSGGAGAGELRGPRDTVAATRTGPPDRLRCHVAG